MLISAGGSCHAPKMFEVEYHHASTTKTIKRFTLNDLGQLQGSKIEQKTRFYLPLNV